MLQEYNGDFAKTTAFKNEKLARSRNALRGPTHQLAVRMRTYIGPRARAHAIVRLPCPDTLALCTLEAAYVTIEGLPHAIY